MSREQKIIALRTCIGICVTIVHFYWYLKNMCKTRKMAISQIACEGMLLHLARHPSIEFLITNISEKEGDIVDAYNTIRHHKNTNFLTLDMTVLPTFNEWNQIRAFTELIALKDLVYNIS